MTRNTRKSPGASVPIGILVGMYEQGVPTKEIAAQFSIGVNTLRRRLKEAGVVLKTGRKTSGICSVCSADPIFDGGKCRPCLLQYMSDQGLVRRYGITRTELRKMWRAQDRRCAICQVRVRFDAVGKHKICVDHDHVSGSVRGLLCWSCNYGLGFFGDSLDGITRAFNYLRGGDHARI